MPSWILHLTWERKWLAPKLRKILKYLLEILQHKVPKNKESKDVYKLKFVERIGNL